MWIRSALAIPDCAMPVSDGATRSRRICAGPDIYAGGGHIRSVPAAVAFWTDRTSMLNKIPAVSKKRNVRFNISSSIVL